MSITVNIGEAKARLSELVSKVEAGEELIIARAKEPIARLVPFEDRVRAVIDEILAIRDDGRINPVTRSEILAWRHADHEY